MSYKLRFISLACFVLPVFTVIISYIISINLDLVAKCIPNFEGCTSISRVGRYEPVKFFFKPMMYFYSLIIFFFWITFSKEINNNTIDLSKLKDGIYYIKLNFDSNNITKKIILNNFFIKNF